MARVMTSGAVSRGGRPGFFLRAEEGWRSCHQSSTSTYNETRKESRSTMRHHLWAKVWYQHRVSAPSAFPAITHHSSKYSGPSSCPYSAECVEGLFCEVRLALRTVASCLRGKKAASPR